jgi:hypothetical protein
MKVEFESEAKLFFSFKDGEPVCFDDLRAIIECCPKHWRFKPIAYADIPRHSQEVTVSVGIEGIYIQGN